MGNHQYREYGDTASDKNNFMDRIFPTNPFNHYVMNRIKEIGNNNIVYTIEWTFNFFNGGKHRTLLYPDECIFKIKMNDRIYFELEFWVKPFHLKGEQKITADQYQKRREEKRREHRAAL